MRIRYKPWARKELEESPFYREHPEEFIGKWKEEFEQKGNPFFVELRLWKGKLYCAKGTKTSRK